MIKYIWLFLLSTTLHASVLVISGPAGTGKTTLVEKLKTEFPEVVQSISYTTRAPRRGEIDGVHYNFVTTHEFEKMLDKGDFLEHIKLYDCYYGTSKSALEKHQAAGKHVIIILDTAGFANVKEKLDATYIFIRPPAPEIQTLRQRLNKRNTETDSAIEKRLARASKELIDGKSYDYQIVNDNFDEAYHVLKCIFIAETHRIKPLKPSGFRQSIIHDETDHMYRSKLLLPSQVDEYVFKLGGKDFYQIVFDLDLKTALEKGYKISVKSFFELTSSIAMEHTALYCKKVLMEQFGSADNLSMADLFTGTGQAAFGFAKSGFKVTATELDDSTYQYAKNNLHLSGLKDTTVLHMSALDFIQNALMKKEQFSVIFLDPPWNGKYTYNLHEPFLLDYTDPNAKDLIRQSLQLAPIVVLKGPQNISEEQVRSLGNELHCRTVIEYQKMANYPDELNHAVVYFIKTGSIDHSSHVVNLRSYYKPQIKESKD